MCQLFALEAYPSLSDFRRRLAMAGQVGATNQLPPIQFDRFVAINTPVRMVYGVSKLDEFYRAPLDWPDAERTDNIENTFLKVAALSKSTLTPQTSLPFSAIESKFLIGLTFRLMLRDIIFSSQPVSRQQSRRDYSSCFSPGEPDGPVGCRPK